VVVPRRDRLGDRVEQEEIRTYVAEVEPLLRAGATVHLDARLPVSALADAIEQLL
jgi:hypothetical protein